MTPSEFIDRFKPRHFFHFTDKRNVESIREHGLLPLADLRRSGIQPAAPGGNAWSHEEDERRGLDRYIHLCLFPEHPMEYVARRKEKRLGKTRFLRITTEVIHWADIRFTSEVANKASSKLLTFDQACLELDFEVVYDRLDWKNPKVQARRQLAKKYELLVPNAIGIEHLTIPSNG